MKNFTKILLNLFCFFTINNIINAQAPTDGLVAYYPFNGNASDASGNNRNGVISGGVVPSTDRLGNTNQAYAFNGNNGYITISNWNILTGNSARTISLWFKTSTIITVTTGGEQYLLSWGDVLGKTSSFVTFLDPNTIRYIGFMSNTSVSNLLTPSAQFHDNRWHMMTFTHDGSNSKLFLDGVLQNSNINITLNTNTTKLIIGCFTSLGYHFNGSLDDIRIYNRALSVSEVQQTYLSEVGSSTTTDVIKLSSDKFLHATGSENTYVGIRAGAFAMGQNNTFLGHSVGVLNKGNFNSFIGSQAGISNSSGANNTFLGSKSGYKNVTGMSNTFLGSSSGTENTSGNNNTFLGNISGQFNTVGEGNTFIGAESGTSNTIGYSNTFLGYRTGFLNSNGYNNVYVGHIVGVKSTSASNNVFVGWASGNENTTGNDNTALGAQSGGLNTIGIANTYVGKLAGYYNVSGSLNTYIGAGADGFGQNKDKLYNVTAIGFNAKVSINNAIVLGDTSNAELNVGIGTTRPSKRLEVRAANLNESGIRTTNLTSTSPTTSSNGKVLTVNNLGDFILVPDIAGTGVNTHSDSVFVRSVTNTNFSGGNLGIGVTSPQYKLDVRGTVNIRGINGGLGELKFMGYNFLRGDRNFNSSLGFDSEVDSKYSHSTAIGYKAFASANNVLILGGTKENSVNVGIGNSAPREKMEITSDRDGESGLMFTNLNTNSTALNSSSKFLSVDENGKVGLYNLSANQITIKINNLAEWSDKVFASNYQLMSIDKVEKFIKTEGHLPNIPSAKNMIERGVSMQEMFAKLLEKNEELLLYVLEQNKINTQQAIEIEELKKEIQKIKK